MTESDIHEVSYELGMLKQGLETILKTLSEDRVASAQYRTDIRRQLTDHSEKMGKIEAGLNGAVANIDKIVPKVERLEDLNATVTNISAIVPKVEALEKHSLMKKGERDLATRLAYWIEKAAHAISALIGAAIALFADKWMHMK